MTVDQHPQFDHNFPERFPHWDKANEPFRTLVPDILCEFEHPLDDDLNDYNRGLRTALWAVAAHATIEEAE